MVKALPSKPDCEQTDGRPTDGCASHAGLPDIMAPGLKVVFCGINPGAAAAAGGHHFIGRGNRFWRVLHDAGFTPHRMDPKDDRQLLRYGCGLTTAVARPTARADQLSSEEFVDAASALCRKLALFAPAHIAFLGKAAFSAMTREPQLRWGLQPDRFAGALAWVLPNPSGLNRSFSIEQLVEAYGTLRAAAWPDGRSSTARAARVP
jgi:TDG/mug DNA glycosylase family protein